MYIIINGEEYTLDTSAMTALRYRIAYGWSVFDADGSDAKEDYAVRIDKLAKLIYVAIDGERPSIHHIKVEFLKGDKTFYRMVGDFYGALMHQNKPRTLDAEPKKEQPEPRDGGEKKEFDEYELFCAYILLGLPYEFLKEIPILESIHLISTMGKMKYGGGKEKLTKLDAVGRKKMYSITVEDESKIRAYLDARKGG